MENLPPGLKHHQRIDLTLLCEIYTSLSPVVSAPHKLKHFLCFNTAESTLNNTDWYIHRDSAGKINAAVCYDRRDFYTHVFCHPDHAHLIAEQLVFGLKRFDGANGTHFDHMFGGIEEDVAAALESALQRQQGRSFVTTIDSDRFEKWTLDTSSKEWEKSVSTAAQPLPEGFYDDSLRLDDADMVNNAWTYRSNRSFAIVKDCIQARVSTAIRYRDPASGKEELIAWALSRTDFAVSMVKVSENHRRKGLGTRVVIRLIQKILDLRPIEGCELDPSQRPIAVCFIDKDNEASKQMHRQMGFAQHPLWHRWIRA